MTTKKQTKKAPPPRTIAARSVKTAAARAASQRSTDSTWLIAAAAAAWHAADPNEGGCEEWDDDGAATEAARYYAARVMHGDDVIDMMRETLKREGDAGSGQYFKAPAGFRGWSKYAAELFEQLGVVADVDVLHVDQLCQWSVYHLDIARDPKDPLHDPRGEDSPSQELRAMVQSIGAVLKPLFVVVRKSRLVVSDGRQRTNTVLALNQAALLDHYMKVERVLRYREPQRKLLDASHLELPPPPVIIRGVPVLVKPLEQGRILKAVSNTGHKAETFTDQMRAVWDLETELKAKQTKPAKPRKGVSAGDAPDGVINQIARMRGCSDQNVYDLLSLRKLTEKWLALLEQGRITGKTAKRLAREPEDRQKKCGAAFDKASAKDSSVKLDAFVKAWLDNKGEGETAIAVAMTSPKQKVKEWDGMSRLRDHLRTDSSPEAQQVLKVLNALGAFATTESQDALEALPPRWRVAIADEPWLPPKAKPLWNAIGVYDPETRETIEDGWYGVRDDDEFDPEDEDLLEFAKRPFEPDVDGSPSIGQAVEEKLCSDDVLRELLRSYVLPEAGKAAVIQPSAAKEQQALPVAVAPKEPKAKARRKSLPWIGFTTGEQDSWETSGVTSYVTAIELRGAGLTPAQLAQVIPLDGKPRNSLGVLFMYGSLTIEEVQATLEAHPLPTGLENRGAA